MRRARAVEVIFDPLIELLRPMSPLVTLSTVHPVVRHRRPSKIVIIAFACSFPVILNTYAGVKGIDPTLFKASRSLGASPWEIMHTIVLRGSMPHIFTGLRLAWGIALIVIVAAEMIGAVRGIGYMVLDSQQTFRIPRLFGSIAVIGLLGFVTDIGFRYLGRQMMPWHHEASV
jgi:NitT/TauT family transport system permease protein